MIAVGIDAVDIQRFVRWARYSPKTLGRIFSADEIAYCLECPIKSAERFAVRFAVKEAFYKALCAAYPARSFSSFLVARQIHVINKTPAVPLVLANWEPLQCTPLRIFASLSHAKTIAYATVILE